MTPYGIIRPLAPQKLQSVKCIFSGVQWKRLNCSFQIHIQFHNIDSNFDDISSIVQFMMTSSNGNISCVTVPLCREFTGPRWIPAQRPRMRSFDVFFDLLLINGWVNNREAGDLRRHRGHYDVNVMLFMFLTPGRHMELMTHVHVSELDQPFKIIYTTLTKEFWEM